MATNLIPPPIALTIAGSDSGGGAGIQADLKTFHQFGVHGTSVIVAITAQNTVGVRAVHLVPADIVSAQIAALAEDLPPAALKTGMLATAELISLVARGIRTRGWRHFVLDPVMVATAGDRLLATDAESALQKDLLPLAALVTPNLDEAEVLTGSRVRDPDQMEAAGRRLLEMGAGAALIKGGHLDGDSIVDLLVVPGMARRFTPPAHQFQQHSRHRLHPVRRDYRRTGPGPTPGPGSGRWPRLCLSCH
jgi:hydroxymethylpyrimidine/phosphomethylpyrimidine kinase